MFVPMLPACQWRLYILIGALLLPILQTHARCDQPIPAEYKALRHAMGQKRYDLAHQKLDSLLQQKEIFPRVFQTAAFLYIYENKAQAGVTFFEQMLADSAAQEYRGEIAGALATLYHYLKDKPQSLRHAENALRYGCRNLRPYELYIENSNREQAKRFLQQQSRLHPENWRLRHARAYLHQTKNEPAAATTEFFSIVNQGYKCWDVYVTFGNNLNYQARFDEAHQLLTDGIAVCRKQDDEEGLARLLHVLYQTELRRGNLKQAEDLRNESLALARRIGNEILKYSIHLAWSEELLNHCRWSEARQHLDSVRIMARKFSDMNSLLTVFYRLGSMERNLGHWQASRKNFLRASALADSIGQREYALQLLYSIAVTDLNAGRVHQALERFLQNEEQAKKNGIALHRPIYLQNIGNAYEELGQYPQALVYYDSALAHARKSKERRRSLSLNIDRGRVLMLLQRPQGAFHLFQSVADTASQAGFLDLELETKINLGELLRRTGQFAAAESLLTQTLARLQESPNYLHYLKAFTRLAETVLQAGDLQRAIAIYRRALAVVASNTRTANLQQATSLAIDERAIFFGLSRALLRAGETAEALCLTEQARDLVVQRNRWQARQLGENQPEHSARIKVTRLDSLITLQQLRLAVDSVDAETPLLRAELHRLELQRESLVQDLMVNLAAPQPAFNQDALDQFRQSLGNQKEIVISFFVGDTISLAFLVAADTVKGKEISVGRRALEPLLARINPALRLRLKNSSGLTHTAFDTSAAHEAYNLLLRDFLAVRKEKALALIPDDVLHALPFEVLVTEPATQTEVQHLVKSHVTRYGLSLQSLHQPEAKQFAVNSFLLIADPQRGRTLANRTAATQRRMNYYALPGSKAELQAITQTVKIQRTLAGTEATRENVLAALPDCDWLHIASHAASEAGEPLFAEILLSEMEASEAHNKIYAFEIFRMHLRAKIAILSGCETARGLFLNGEGFEGFVQAFRAAGTPSVIASLWSVDDMVTAKFFQRYYHALSRGKTAVQALQTAKLEILSNEDNSVLDWAGFCYYGYDWQVQLESPNNAHRWLILGILLVALTGGGFIYWRRRTRSSV